MSANVACLGLSSAVAARHEGCRTAADDGMEFDEEKCRNVLVRYCAHIPRNYQYRDGLRIVFLVLRDHLGDEQLGRACGVLYEMIEVDCQHSDDPGAAFQRWRYAHMNRHSDLELPHVPHLTTVTSAIIPTAALTKWRREHAHRYHTRLSDYSPSKRKIFDRPGCVRTRKSWMIDYTMYVSSRDGGTRPFRSIKPQEFHKLQWKQGANQQEKASKEMSSSATNFSNGGVSDKPLPGGSEVAKFCLKPHLDKANLRTIFQKISPKKPSNSCQSQLAWLTGITGVGATSSLRELLEPKQSPRVAEWEIPNANFARKYGIFTESHTLPPSIKELPVAEDKVLHDVAGSSAREIKYSWRFQGPFTPQLWFDSGLDYRWKRK